MIILHPDEEGHSALLPPPQCFLKTLLEDVDNVPVTTEC